MLERPIHADVALVYAARGDELGNLWYRRTARNFNPLMATAARVTIAEVERSWQQACSSRSRSTRRTCTSTSCARDDGDVKTSIAARAAQELRPGEIVNLGIGIPNLIPGLLGDTTSSCTRRTGFSGSGRGPARTSSTRTSSTRRSSP